MSNSAWADGAKLSEFTFSNNQKFRVGFDGRNIIAQFQPRQGDGEFRFASWTLRDWRNNFKNIRKYNKNRPLKKHQFVTIPFRALNDNMQALVLQALFSNDSSEEEGWVHRVKFLGETVSLIAGVFAEKNVSAAKLITHNKLEDQGTTLNIGDVIVIPWPWVRKELNLKPIKVRQPLTVKIDRFGKRYAYYRIKKGESLYSSVIVRFTGRTLAEDVNRMARELLKINQIADEHYVQAGSEVKIPLEWISEEYLIQKLPTPSAEEPDIKVEPKTPIVKGQPVHIIIDPGHGGRDPGAVFKINNKGEYIFEDETVYDIGLRIKALLKKSRFIVHTTLSDPNQSQPVDKLADKKDEDEKVLVNPPYNIRSANIAVNMRVYLVNHIYQSLIKKKIPKENILLVSIHGDALHKSLRGATVYFPDARLRKAKFDLKRKIYRKRREYRHCFKYQSLENKAAAKLSSNFGKIIITSFKNAGLHTHRSFSVRGYYYRKGKRTLPAILRYSKIPTSVLVEVGNLNNSQDRKLLRKAEYRQKLAETLVKSFQVNFKNI